MRKFCVTVSLAVGLLAHAMTACAAPTINYADSVVSYTSKIQNFGWDLMNNDTPEDETDDYTWWVLGMSDADPNGDGIFTNSGANPEPDNLGGWRSTDADQHIIVQFDDGLDDVAGNDLVIRMFGGSIASASVLASVDNVTYTEIGTIGSGTPKCFRDEVFDFGGAFVGNAVHYVKVERVTIGGGSGMFFDSFASVPEPTTLVMLALGGLLMAARWTIVRRRRAG